MPMGVREGKNKGGRKKFARLFRIVPDYIQSQKFFQCNKYISATPPPRRQKISDSVPFWGSKKFFRTYKFFRNIKISKYCPNVKRILPDLPLFAQYTGDFFAFSLFYFPLFARLISAFARLFGGAAAPPAPPPPSRTPMSMPSGLYLHFRLSIGED